MRTAGHSRGDSLGACLEKGCAVGCPGPHCGEWLQGWCLPQAGTRTVLAAEMTSSRRLGCRGHPHTFLSVSASTLCVFTELTGRPLILGTSDSRFIILYSSLLRNILLQACITLNFLKMSYDKTYHI